MKLVREHINEAKFTDILKPLSKEQILDDLSHFSKEEKNEKLVFAASNENIKVVEMLLKAGADVNTKGFYSCTPLILASINGHINIVKLLLKAGANVNAKEDNGTTCLMKASLYGYKDIVKLLLKAGADVNANDKAGNTAWGWASSKGIVELLKKYGAKYPWISTR